MNEVSNQRMCGLIDRTVKVEGISQLINLFFGSRPIVDKYSDYTEINFTKEQQEQIEDLLNRWYDAEPGEIRINVKSILLPFYLKKFMPWLIGGAAVSVLTGFLLSKTVGK